MVADATRMPISSDLRRCLTAWCILTTSTVLSECNDGDAGFDRPGHEFAGSPVPSEDAAACRRACDAIDTCKQWAWSRSTKKCRLKNLISLRVAHSDFCSATRKADPHAVEKFPVGNFTPFTYLQNPYHRVFHHSGQIRSDEAVNGLGLHWDDPHAADEQAPAPNAWSWAYQSILAVSARPRGVSGPALLMNDDFVKAGVERLSEVHTKSRLRVRWAAAGARVSAEYWQVAENLIACEVEITNNADSALNAAFDVTLHANGSSGNTAHATYNATGTHHSVCADVGGVAVGMLVLEADVAPAGHGFFPSASSAASGLPSRWASGGATYSNPAASQLVASMTFSDVHVGANASETFLFLMARGPDCDNVSRLLRASDDVASIAEVRNQRAYALADDARFWQGAPVPTGHFADAWKHGVVYDLNTVRLNLRPAVGIFSTEWDAMQIHHPRVVVAEATMDFLALSYADPSKAKEVILGLFSDAIAPNVPCVWENGQPNMVCDDGSVAGTPPAWGNPLKNILSVYQRDSDKAWLAKLYPKMSAYLEFWVTHRKMHGTDYLTCRCSWECGQDDEPRWSFNQTSGGSLTDRFRVVEMQAATAHGAAVLAFFARELGRPAAEVERWQALITKYTRLTHSLWEPIADSPFGGWFSDFDTTTGARSPFGAWNMQLAPLFFHDRALGVDLFPTASGVNASRLAESITTTFWSTPPGLVPNISFCEHTTPEWGHDLCRTVSGQLRPAHNSLRLDRVWAPSPWTMAEGAAAVGRRDIASTFTERTLDTVYPVMDLRTKEEHHPLPGCAYEAWDTAMMDPSLPPVSDYLMAEAYGWSAIATVLFLRTVIGFRELPAGGGGRAAGVRGGDDDDVAFELAPALPAALLARPFCPQEYGVQRLHFQGRTYKLTYTHPCGAAKRPAQLRAHLTQVEQSDGRSAGGRDGSHDARRRGGRLLDLVFDATNGRRYHVSVGGSEPRASLLQEDL